MHIYTHPQTRVRTHESVCVLAFHSGLHELNRAWADRAWAEQVGFDECRMHAEGRPMETLDSACMRASSGSGAQCSLQSQCQNNTQFMRNPAHCLFRPPAQGSEL